MKTLIFVVVFFLFSTVQFAYSCSLIPNPLNDFDKTEYTFIGEVIGYTEPLEFNRNLTISSDRELRYKQASGLIVKVKDSVYLPKNPKTYFEVFPFRLDAGCATLGMQRDELKKDYPKNSEILVIAKEAIFFPHVLPNGNFRIEVQQGRNTLITLNKNENNQKLTSIDSVFDYKKTEGEEALINSGIYFGSKFEVRKDLLRLTTAKTPKAKEEILERISYFHKSYTVLNFYALLKKYSANSKESLEIYENYLQFSDFSKEIILGEIELWKKHIQSRKKN